MSESTSPSPDGLDAAGVLAVAVQRRRAADAAEADLLALAAHWADLHAVLRGQDAAGFESGCLVGGVERLVPLAGDGTPEVAEFAPAELGAALGMSTYAAGVLVGNALELRHRLPRLWARVMAGDLPAWRAGQVAEHTKALNPAAAAYVDAQLAPVAHKLGLTRILNLVQAAIARHDPDLAAAKERQAAEGRGVWCSDEMTNGTRSIRIVADALDAEAFDQQIDRIAHALRALGDPDTSDVRRAKAVGVIADPQGTLDLLAGDNAGPQPATDPQAGRPANRGGRAGRQVVAYVHLSESAIRAGVGIARVEDLGPATLDLVKTWLGRDDTAVTVKPVLDPADQTPVDGYETPQSMRETVLLRTPCCPFPWCTNLSRHKDMDHVVPYVDPDDGGPPGQTGPVNLGPLCRRHHRLKTHSGWTYAMPVPGIYLWRSPQGQRYLVDHTGTRSLHSA